MSSPSLSYVEPPDVPEGMTLAEYRRARARARARSPQRGLLARLRRRHRDHRAARPGAT